VSLFRFLLEATEEARTKHDLQNEQALGTARKHIAIALKPLNETQMQRPDAELLKREVLRINLPFSPEVGET